MVPLFVLGGVFVTGLVLGELGVKRFRSSSDSLRYALSAMFLLTAWAHFGSYRADLVRMVPPLFPNPELLVTLTGFAEIAGAVGLLIPRFTRAAAIGLTLLLVAVFPANVHAAQAGLTLGGSPVTGIALRSAEQLVFLAATIAVAVHARKFRSRSRTPTPHPVST
jgi:uncharacterized membrane protein